MSGDQSMMLRKQPTHIPELNTKQGNPLTAVLRILSLLKLWKNVFFPPKPNPSRELASLLGHIPFVCSLQKRFRRRLGEQSKLGAGPRTRTGRRCPTPTRCCTRCRGSSPSCHTCPAALLWTPTSGATSFPRWVSAPSQQCKTLSRFSITTGE